MAEDASFQFFAAPRPLAGFVEYFYASEIPRGFVSCIDAIRLPEIEAQLVFVIEDASEYPGGLYLGNGLRASLFLQPAHLQMVPIPGSICQAVGASLSPAGLRILLPRGAGGFTDTPRISLEDLLGAEARELLERLVASATVERRCAVLRAYLLDRASRVALPSKSVVHAVELLRGRHGEISTEQLALACGCTSRTLRSAALAETGLTPKHLARVARIRRALDLLTTNGVPLSQAAMAAAFSDQAHMSREFRELLGLAPSDLNQRIRSALPAHTAQRNLMSTGLLVVPKSAAR